MSNIFHFSVLNQKKKKFFIRKYLQIKVSVQRKDMRFYNILEFSVILNHLNSWAANTLGYEDSTTPGPAFRSCRLLPITLSSVLSPLGRGGLSGSLCCSLSVRASCPRCSPANGSAACTKMTAPDAPGPNWHTWFHFAGRRLMGGLQPHICSSFVWAVPGRLLISRGIGRRGFALLSFSSCGISKEGSVLEDIRMLTFLQRTLKKNLLVALWYKSLAWWFVRINGQKVMSGQ